MKYYLDHYDVIVIGASLAGLSCAISLAKEGKKVLVLESHNLPGGVATSFVRDGIEIEATLHEAYSIGSEEDPLHIRKFFSEIGYPIQWKKVPESYRFKDKNTDILIPSSYEEAAKKIDELYPGNYEEVMRFFTLCHEVNASISALENGIPSLKGLIKNNASFFKTVGYTLEEVLDSFDLRKEIKEILSCYWIYLGTPPDVIPFTIMAVVLDEYINHSPYIPQNKSFEMGAKLAQCAASLGVQIEYAQMVKHILVKKNKVYGVSLKSGIEVYADYVVAGIYPQNVYSKMIYPSSEVPAKAFKYASSRDINVSGIQVQILLEGTPEENHINSYSTFFYPGEMDSHKAYDEMNSMGPYNYMALVCYNMANEKASPKGTTLICLCAMPRCDAWEGITKEDYFKIKRKVALDMIKNTEECLGIDILNHIIDIIYETPVSIAHYAQAYKGAVYGFNHSLDDHFLVRHIFPLKNQYIKHLFFTGAHTFSGDGQTTQINNGISSAKIVLSQMKKEAK